MSRAVLACIAQWRAQFHGLAGRAPALWPTLPRALCAAGICLLVTAAGGWFIWQPQYEALEEVRQKGYAREDEQCEIGMRSLAAPIRDADGRVVAAVGVAGPTQRLSEDVMARFAPLVVNTANLISARLGYRAIAGF